MEETTRILKLNKDYKLQKLAANVKVIQSDVLNENSLGPFLRISENTTNIIYQIAYFNSKIEETDFELKATTGGSETHEEIQINTYKIDIKATKQTVSSDEQSLWAFIIKADVDVSKLKLVISNVDFNYSDAHPTDLIPIDVEEFYYSSEYPEFEKNFDPKKHIDLQPIAKKRLKKLKKKIKKNSHLTISVISIAYMLTILYNAPKRATRVIIANVLDPN